MSSNYQSSTNFQVRADFRTMGYSIPSNFNVFDNNFHLFTYSIDINKTITFIIDKFYIFTSGETKKPISNA